MARRFVLPSRPALSVRADFDADLNEQQRAAVTCGDGPKLVIAGAGTGKTRTLTYRVAYLLSQGVPPDGLLLVTFTNKAAREMVGRVRELTGIDGPRLWAGTFHSIGARLLRRHGALFGYNESFSILDESDQRDVMRLCITDVGVDVKRRRFPAPRLLCSMISLSANTGDPIDEILVDRYPRFVDWGQEIIAVTTRYAERKHAANAMDYDDLLLLWLRMLLEYPELQQRYAQQFRHVLVDEYQDTNRVQGAIVEAIANGSQNVADERTASPSSSSQSTLAGGGEVPARSAAVPGNLMVVGDDCQSIYAFRGAHYENILGFPERNPGTEVFKLEVNYRSTPQILALTNDSIRHNQGQFTKELTAKRRSGMLPALVACNYPEQEAAFVAERLLQLRDEGTELDRVAVLYRAHSHRLSLETTLLRYDIPYEIRGGLRFFEQAHIKDVTAYLRVIANPQDEVALRRLLLMQPGVGNVTAERVRRAIGTTTDAAALLRLLTSPEVLKLLRRHARGPWAHLVEMLTAVQEKCDEPETAIRTILLDGYADYAAAHFTNFDSRMEDLEQLAVFATQYDTIASFLEELVLLGELHGQDVQDLHRDEPRVVLSTIHQAKGLEWDAVFLIHLVEGAIPSPRAIDEGGEEEERRIFYVGMTRARSELYLSYPIVRPGASGSLLQQPSRFVQELQPHHVEPWELAEAEPPATARPPRAASSASTGTRFENRGSASSSSRFSGFQSADPERPWDHDPNVDPIWEPD